MPHSSAALAIPDMPPASAPGQAPHGPAPRRKPVADVRGLPRAGCLDIEPMTDPAITGIAVSGNSVLAATSDDPLFNAHLGSLEDFERNLRGWGEACGASPDTVDALVAKLRRAGQ